jgi:hypothetical protein
VPEAHVPTLLLGAGAFAFLVLAARFAKPLLARLGATGNLRLLLANAAPLLAVVQIRATFFPLQARIVVRSFP